MTELKEYHFTDGQVGGSSYIYEQVGEMIDDWIRDSKQLPHYAN